MTKIKKKYNKNGEEMCNALNCRKYKQLIAINGEKFCKYHIGTIMSINKSLQYAKETNNIQLVEYYKQQEIDLRKFPKIDDELVDYLSL